MKEKLYLVNISRGGGNGVFYYMTKLQFKVGVAVIISAICLLVVSFYLFSIYEVSDVYKNETQKTILSLKKDFLKNTVNNLISEINITENTKKEYMEKLVNNTYDIIEAKLEVPSTDFDSFFLDFFQNNPEYDSWEVLLWDSKDKAIYDSQKLAQESWEDTLDTIKAQLSAYRIIRSGDARVVFGISQSYIDKLVKEEIADKIRSLKFDDGSYIWVNEILNYDGGKNYAIRRIHPNLPDTEGMYLSTDMTDIKGDYPYLTELEGVKKDGELFFQYYFKELNSDEISEKLTYAKLYKNYNWVIAMGIYMDDLDTFTQQTNRESKALASRLTAVLVLLFLVILMISYTIIMLIEKLRYKISKRLLETEINQDELTKASSRRSGTNDLVHAFKAFRKNGINCGIMMFDIDNFKNINDTYGHLAGDQVLIEITKAIYQVIRSSDRLIRWGGDEFILIFSGLNKSVANAYGMKILSVVAALKIPLENEIISPTLSIGFSYFRETDTDYTEAVRRADQALYVSKTNGRNQVNLNL
jgi:diguanylate cyclase (GGDEF)-like protein